MTAQQAEQFLGWHHKMGGDWRLNFELWAESKDFTARQRFEVRSAVVELLTPETTTDPFDWFRFGA